jgi:hypothetical protein
MLSRIVSTMKLSSGYNNGFFSLQKEAEKVNDVAVKIEEKTATLQVSAFTVVI